MLARTFSKVGLPALLLVNFCVSSAALSTERSGSVSSGSARTENSVVKSYLSKVETRLKPRFKFAGVQWPPQKITLVAIKETRQMELWAMDLDDQWHYVHRYRLKGLSGELGPKLQEGDKQVPEGFYQIEALNPNSRYHLSLKLNYPNRLDRTIAAKEGRTKLGGNIFIHGKDVSSGCLAIGDNSIEELFVLTSLIGKDAVDVIIASKDFRIMELSSLPDGLPDWSYRLSAVIAEKLQYFPAVQKLR